jgi:hypothetical protein
LFRGDIGEGSSRLPSEMTTTARILDSIVRKTVVPREGFRDGLTRLHQWVLSHLIRKIPFGLRDLMLCEIKDVIFEGFVSKRHLHYDHWLTFLMILGIKPFPLAARIDYLATTVEFGYYDASQLLRSATRETLESHRTPVRETAVEQDETIRLIAAIEEA